VASPFKECEIEINRGEGIDRIGEIVNYCVMYNVIEKSGTWYNYKEERLGQGINNVVEALKKSPKALAVLEKQLKKAMG